MDAAIEVRRFEAADDAIDMKEAGGISIIKMGDGTTGMLATFEPGWTWKRTRSRCSAFRQPARCVTRATVSAVILWFAWLNPTQKRG